MSGAPTFAALGLVTADLEQAVRFYRLLGVDVPDPGGDHLEVTLPNGLRLMWDSAELVRQIDPDRPEPVGGRIALAFECASPAAVDEVYHTVVGAGFAGRKAPWDAFWGQRYATVDDPDGNPVDLFAALG